MKMQTKQILTREKTREISMIYLKRLLQLEMMGVLVSQKQLRLLKTIAKTGVTRRPQAAKRYLLRYS